MRGNTAFVGGGIFNDSGTAMLTHSTVRENISLFRFEGGGGILNHGTLFLTNSTVRFNTGGSGDVVNDFRGTVTLTHSTVGTILNLSSTVILTHSTVDGIRNFDARATVNLTNSTVRRIDNSDASLTLTNSTVSVGIFNRFFNGTVILTNSIVAGCTNDGGTITSNDFNLDSDGTCHLDQPHDKPNNPNTNLGPLQVNAPGTTATHTLLPGSAAINMGDCSGGTITDDQRGVPRPEGRIACDIGGFEVAIPGCTPVPAPDLNDDGVVNLLDVSQVGSCVGENPTANSSCQVADINDDGSIDRTDVSLVMSRVGQ